MTPELKAELIKKITDLKETTRMETGSFKYDFCYDEVIKMIQDL